MKEAQDLSSGYLSNVVLVLESRYVASEGREVKKSRFCLDYRKVNQDISMTHWHLPNMDDFRRRMSSGEFKIFTNLDCSQFYYQLKISERSGKLFSGFWAANKLWIWLRLPMGWSLSGSYGQFWIDQAFKEHQHSRPFMDDISIYSIDLSEMLASDLPLCLAICSAYGLLLSPKKAEFCTTKLRVLGFEVSEGARGISQEKVEKIRNLTFPETRPELISCLAFFAWFLSCNAKLSDALGPLRDLARPKTRYLPTKQHRDAFQSAKDRLLDPALGRIRTPSSNLEDDLILATDSSHYALGAVLLQKLSPTSAEIAAGVPADAKQLYIVQIFSKTLPPEKRQIPIFLKEFYALDLAVDKFDFLLRARPFIVVVDNKVLRYWANLERIDDAMTRRVLKLQTYDFKIVFVESKLQPADIISRWEEDDKADGIYHQRFLQGRILNGYGKEVPLTSLFCSDTKTELDKYFTSSKRQTQSIPAEMVTNPKKKEEDLSIKLPKQTSKQSKSVACITKKTPIMHDSWEKPLQKVELKILPQQQPTNHPAKLKRKCRATKRWKRQELAFYPY